MTFEEAWALYFANHPEVLANWAHQNGLMPRCLLGGACGCPAEFDR